MTDPVLLVAALALLVAAAEWLARRGPLRHVGSALVVILLGATAANLGIIPAGSTADAPVPVYDAVFGVLAPLALFWLLLHVNVRQVLTAGVPLIVLFLAGAAGTALGVIVGVTAIAGEDAIGPLYNGIAGMLTGTFIGGSINFNAVALEYDVIRDGALYTGTTVADNIITAVWMAVTIAVPRLWAARWQTTRVRHASATTTPIVDLQAETETLTPRGLAAVVALGLASVWISGVATRAAAGYGWNVPSILILTAIALVFAQMPVFNRMAGPRLLGMAAVYVFLAVVGAFCDVRALGELGGLGLRLLSLMLIIVGTHGLVVLLAARLLRQDLDAAAVASQANIGGGTSALALAKSLGREDLLVPAILLGALGNAIGTFIGFAVARLV